MVAGPNYHENILGEKTTIFSLNPSQLRFRNKELVINGGFFKYSTVVGLNKLVLVDS